MNPARRALLTHSLPLLAAPLWLSACSKPGAPATTQPVPAGAAVLAFGDSLTSGYGATPEQSYPSVLARLTGWQIVNGGVPGNSAAEALARLPALLEQHAPKLVLVGIGGNDFLRGLPEAQTRADVRRICELSLASRAQVLLIAMPKPEFWRAALTGALHDHPLYAELAEELKLPLQQGGWSHVLADSKLRSDNIHANAEGYAQLAARVAETAKELGLWAGR